MSPPRTSMWPPAARLMEGIRALGADMTVLMVSHDLSFVARTVPKGGVREPLRACAPHGGS
jgi:hypothetical protein